jgi:hypothetical protein
MVKRTSNIRLDIKEFKSIHVWDQFYRITLYTTWSLPKTRNGNRCILVVINHYSKWVKTKAITKHEARIIVNFFEDEIICMFRVSKYILTNNGDEWVAKFDQLCKNYGIAHRYTTLQCPKCNDMAESGQNLEAWVNGYG